jgi:cytochrome c oxidase cbb3-type subunit 1
METKNIFSESGIIITLLLIAIPVIVASILVIIRAKNAVLKNFLKKKELEKFNEYVKGLSTEEVQKLEQRKKELEFSLSNNELAGDTTPN